MSLLDAVPRVSLIYDGECPFCSSYVRLLRLRRSFGAVHLVNARDGGDLVAEVTRRGYVLDEGMVLVLDGKIFAGAEAMHRLALLSTANGFFNRLNRAIFSSERCAQLLYPLLRRGRNLTLWLRGRRPLG